jgi:hypothetical protein
LKHYAWASGAIHLIIFLSNNIFAFQGGYFLF